MQSIYNTGSKILRGAGFSPASLLLVLVLATTLSMACNPFSDKSGPLPDEEATEQPAPELAEVGLERILASTENQAAAKNSGAPTASPDPSPTPSNPNPTKVPVPAAGSTGNSDEARNQVWAYLTQCVSIEANDLVARQIQGEWFVQAAGESPDQFGLWKVDPSSGSIQAHNIRARQWEPLVNQNCTADQFIEFFPPTPSPLGIPEVTEANQAVTTLWATLVNCFPNMAIDDLQATLNPARGEWVVTSRTDISANYGVWAVASDGTVSPRNRQAQGVFDQLDSSLC